MEFAEGLKDAVKAGVKVIPVQALVGPEKIVLVKKLPCRI